MSSIASPSGINPDRAFTGIPTAAPSATISMTNPGTEPDMHPNG
jgi:hypothetical protein